MSPAESVTVSDTDRYVFAPCAEGHFAVCLSGGAPKWTQTFANVMRPMLRTSRTKRAIRSKKSPHLPGAKGDDELQLLLASKRIAGESYIAE